MSRATYRYNCSVGWTFHSAQRGHRTLYLDICLTARSRRRTELQTRGRCGLCSVLSEVQEDGPSAPLMS